MRMATHIKYLQQIHISHITQKSYASTDMLCSENHYYECISSSWSSFIALMFWLTGMDYRVGNQNLTCSRHCLSYLDRMWHDFCTYVYSHHHSVSVNYRLTNVGGKQQQWHFSVCMITFDKWIHYYILITACLSEDTWLIVLMIVPIVQFNVCFKVKLQ